MSRHQKRQMHEHSLEHHPSKTLAKHIDLHNIVQNPIDRHIPPASL